MKISGSILAVNGNYLDYAKTLQYAYVDYLHIDIFQNSDEFKLKDILQFDNTYLPLDVHLIYNQVRDDDINILNQANIRYCNIQFESLIDKASIYDISKKFNGNIGLAITSKTSIDEIDEYISTISQLLFMCSEPGVSGVKFDEINFERIVQVHDRYPSLELFADGGINDVIGEKIGKLGVSTIVSGSYLCKDISMLNLNAYRLRYLNETNINVTRNMIRYNFLPILSKQASFMDVINVMNEYRLGIVFVVEDEKLLGIITDGEIRRGFIQFNKSIFNKKAIDLMNSRPFIIESDKSMEDIFEQLPKKRKGIEVIPVMEEGRLIGAVDLRMGV